MKPTGLSCLMTATALIGATAVCVAPARARASQATPGTASPLRVLKPGDLGAYASAFAAVRRGDFDTADAELKRSETPASSDGSLTKS